MGAIGPSGFIFRDFIKFVLPTVIGISLLAPFFVPVGSAIYVDSLVFVSVLLGYVIYSPISMLSDFFHSLIPFRNLRLDDARKQNEILIKRWDYDSLWSALSKDEREYLYLTQSYFEFYQTTGFYMLVYFLINLAAFIYNLINIWLTDTINWSSFWGHVNSIRTPTVVQFDLPAWLVITLSGLLAYFLFGDAVLEYNYLRGIGGAFDRYAQKYHKQDGNIAMSVWGEVVSSNDQKGHPVTAIKVVLKQNNGEFVSSVITDPLGSFQFENIFSYCINSECALEVVDNKWQGRISLLINNKTIPYYKIVAVKTISEDS